MTSREFFMFDVISIYLTSVLAIFLRKLILEQMSAFSNNFCPLVQDISSLMLRYRQFLSWQRAHLLAWGLYTLLFYRIHQVTFRVPPASLILHTSSDSLLSVLFPGLVNAFLYSLYLSFQGLFVIPL